MRNKLPNFHYQILKHYGNISDNKVQSKQLNLISYNGAEPKFDLRIWGTDYETGEKIMGKGICMNAEELTFLKKIIDDIEDLDG